MAKYKKPWIEEINQKPKTKAPKPNNIKKKKPEQYQGETGKPNGIIPVPIWFIKEVKKEYNDLYRKKTLIEDAFTKAGYELKLDFKDQDLNRIPNIFERTQNLNTIKDLYIGQNQNINTIFDEFLQIMSIKGLGSTAEEAFQLDQEGIPYIQITSGTPNKVREAIKDFANKNNIKIVYNDEYSDEGASMGGTLYDI